MAVTPASDVVLDAFQHEPQMVAVLRLPIRVSALDKMVAGLEAVYGKGLTLGPGSHVMAVYLPEGSTHE